MLVPDPVRITSDEIHSAIDRVAEGIRQRHPTEKIFLLGIANGGVEFARRLAAKLPHARLGTVDVSFHRDDIGRHPIPKEFVPTQIPGDVNGSLVVLVDDVLFSGRTLKAALDEIFDHGRPDQVELAILADRGARKLPFSADYCGLTLSAGSREKVVIKLHPSDPAQDSLSIRSAQT